MDHRIAICDDSAADAEFVLGFVREWAAKTGVAVQAEVFPSAESFLFRYAEEKDWDILLLDIEMGHMDGVTLAKKLRQENETLQIIFVTGYTDYIAEGYEVSALHYLVKPVNREKLHATLDRAAEKLRRDGKDLVLTSGGDTFRVPVYRITWAEVRLNYVTIHAGEDFTAKMTLGELQSKLDSRFHRVGRSYLVNLTAISRVTRQEITLRGGTKIPLPRGAYEEVNRAIIARM